MLKIEQLDVKERSGRYLFERYIYGNPSRSDHWSYGS